MHGGGFRKECSGGREACSGTSRASIRVSRYPSSLSLPHAFPPLLFSPSFSSSPPSPPSQALSVCLRTHIVIIVSRE